MKNYIYTILTTILIMGCATNKTLDANKLTIGMTRSEVEKNFGKPDRVLHARIEGRQLLETLEYTDKQAGHYKLLFENHKLIEYKLSKDKAKQVHHALPKK